jgi:hypothetical protein
MKEDQQKSENQVKKTKKKENEEIMRRLERRENGTIDEEREKCKQVSNCRKRKREKIFRQRLQQREEKKERKKMKKMRMVEMFELKNEKMQQNGEIES